MRSQTHRLVSDEIMMNNETCECHSRVKGSLLVTSGSSFSLAKFVLSILMIGNSRVYFMLF